MLRYFLLLFIIFISTACHSHDIHYVTATTYNAVAAQCDNTPLITASGYRIKSPRKREMVIAMSRDLKRLYKFGERVRISGAGKLDGVYKVEDTMNKRYRNRIDILLPLTWRHTKLFNVRLNRVVECKYCGLDSNSEDHLDDGCEFQNNLLEIAEKYVSKIFDSIQYKNNNVSMHNALFINYIKTHSNCNVVELVDTLPCLGSEELYYRRRLIA
jgi:3D (Asp-Asp-Asp) domain-containing protein